MAVYLPASSRTGPIQRADTATALYALAGKILVMDDEENVRDVAVQMLKRFGCRAESCRDGREAVELYRKAMEEGDPFDAMIVDLTVPGGMGGKETLIKLLEMEPKAKVIVSSGYSTDPIMANFRQYGFAAVLHKPYRIQALGKTMLDVLKGRQ
jgi:CheY-like chemotaxis protein